MGEESNTLWLGVLIDLKGILAMVQCTIYMHKVYIILLFIETKMGT